MNDQDENQNPEPVLFEPAKKQSFLLRMRRYFLTGLVVAAPIGITIYIGWWFITFVDDNVKPLIPSIYNPENYLPFYNLGSLLRDIGEQEKAVFFFKRAILLYPDNEILHNNLAAIYRSIGKTEEALASYSAALAIAPEDEIARHFHAILSGDNIERATDSYISSLFDDYADNFDNHLKRGLQCKAPEAIANLIEEYQQGSMGTVCDLGCGTGLLGEKIATKTTSLAGVDLSPQMLAKAKSKNIYANLFHESIESHLKDNTYDYYLACDVFPYIGNLNEIWRMLHRSRKFHFGFSVETHEEPQDFVPQNSGRFSHNPQYIAKLCQQFSSKIIATKKTPLRNHGNSKIMGQVFLIEHQA